jgi:hypothetical protein
MANLSELLITLKTMAGGKGTWLAGPGTYSNVKVRSFQAQENSIISELENGQGQSCLAEHFKGGATTLKVGSGPLVCFPEEIYFTKITITSGVVMMVNARSSGE